VSGKLSETDPSGVKRMALFNREKRVDERPIERDREIVEERPADRHRYTRGVTRGLFTLLGVAAAIFLVWLASEIFSPGEGSSDFWIAMGIVAGAGLALGLSQLFGGWTKWGVPRISSGVFLFAWIPTAIVVGWILLAMQPEGGWQQSRLESWSDSIGVLGFVENFEEWLLAVPALILGLVTAFVFDTTGPRQKLETIGRERRVPDEEVHDFRREGEATTVTHRDEPVATGTTTTSSERTTETRPTRRDTP
jgi:hypothetical protein